jgi:hypothetical protein
MVNFAQVRRPCAKSWSGIPVRHALAMKNVVFRCPATGLNVQHQLDDDPDIPDTEYETITCPACVKLHFINRRTGKLMGMMTGPSYLK